MWCWFPDLIEDDLKRLIVNFFLVDLRKWCGFNFTSGLCPWDEREINSNSCFEVLPIVSPFENWSHFSSTVSWIRKSGPYSHLGSRLVSHTSSGFGRTRGSRGYIWWPRWSRILPDFFFFGSPYLVNPMVPELPSDFFYYDLPGWNLMSTRLEPTRKFYFNLRISWIYSCRSYFLFFIFAWIPWRKSQDYIFRVCFKMFLTLSVCAGAMALGRSPPSDNRPAGLDRGNNAVSTGDSVHRDPTGQVPDNGLGQSSSGSNQMNSVDQVSQNTALLSREEQEQSLFRQQLMNPPQFRAPCLEERQLQPPRDLLSQSVDPEVDLASVQAQGSIASASNGSDSSRSNHTVRPVSQQNNPFGNSQKMRRSPPALPSAITEQIRNILPQRSRANSGQNSRPPSQRSESRNLQGSRTEHLRQDPEPESFQSNNRVNNPSRTASEMRQDINPYLPRSVTPYATEQEAQRIDQLNARLRHLNNYPPRTGQNQPFQFEPLNPARYFLPQRHREESPEQNSPGQYSQGNQVQHTPPPSYSALQRRHAQEERINQLYDNAVHAQQLALQAQHAGNTEHLERRAVEAEIAAMQMEMQAIQEQIENGSFRSSSRGSFAAPSEPPK